MFTVGNSLKLTIFGSSHGRYIGGTIDGIPAGTEINTDYISKWLSRRKPAQSVITTQRKEGDSLEIISGIKNNYTDGSPLTFLFKNEDYIDKHYDSLKFNPRPGHADLTMFYKYGEYRNYEGGGFFSGRMTLPLVVAGSIAMDILKGFNIKIISYIKSAGDIKIDDKNIEDEDYIYTFKTRMPDDEMDNKLYSKLTELIKNGDSLGAKIKTTVYNLPPGIGEPFFDSIESEISKAMFSIPGLKGIEFGSGFSLSEMTGSQANDEFYMDNNHIKTKTNHCGGILGGISDGMPVEFTVVMKPTSSIHKEQKTVNLETMKETTLEVKGRHDPFISFRAVPVVQTFTAFTVLDLIMSQKIIKI